MESLSAKYNALETVYKLGYATDSLNYHELAELFYPDKKFNFDIFAILKTPPKDLTLPEYFDIATSSLGGFDATQHALTNPLVTINDDGTVHVKVAVIAYHGLMVDGGVEGATARVLWEIDLEKHQERMLIIKWKVAGMVPIDRMDLFEKGKQRGHSGKQRSSIVRP